MKRFGTSLDWPAPISKRGKVSDPFGDWDKDGLPNMNDCSPKNKNKQDIGQDIGKMISSAPSTISSAINSATSFYNKQVQPAVTNYTNTATKWVTGSGPNFSTNSAAQNMQNINTFNKLAPQKTMLNYFTSNQQNIQKMVKPTPPKIETPTTTRFPQSKELQIASSTQYGGANRYVPNFDKVTVGDIKASGYNNLSEMKAEFINNPEKFYAKTGYGVADQYGNIYRTAADMKTITTVKIPGTGSQPGGGFDYGGEAYASPNTLLITRTPTGTYISGTPEGWGQGSNYSKEKYPGLIDTNISDKRLMSEKTLPASAIKENMRVYVGKDTVMNPYIPSGLGRQDYNIERVPTAYGYGPTVSERGVGMGMKTPLLSPGYKPNTTTPFIPAEAIRDQNQRTYINKEQTLVLNPYYNPR